MEKMLRIFTLLFVFSLIRFASSYGRGPPADKKFICNGMKPSKNTHGQPQTDSIPYEIEFESNEVPKGGALYMYLKSKNDGESYKGFMVQGRNSKGEVIGEFENYRGAKIVPCVGSNGSIGHENADDKNKVTLLWKATDGVELDSDVTFYATMLKAIRTFWTDEPMGSVRIVSSDKDDNYSVVSVESEPEAESEAEGESEPEGEAEGESQIAKKEGVYKDCASSKGCIGAPSSCIDSSSCTVMASYAPSDNGKFRLSLHGKDNANRYLAIGFSKDGGMGDDLVISCRNVGDKPKINFSWNFAKSESSDLVENIPKISNEKISNSNNELTCSFDIDSSVDITIPGKNDVVNYNFNTDSYHLLVAEGPATTSKINYHKIKTASASPVSLKEFTPVGEKSDILIKVHGVLMVISWMACSFIGIMLARYYKETWSTKKPLGMPVWFLSHRALMVLAVTLSIISIVIIMVEIGGWNYSWKFLQENPHPIVGIVTFILCLIQPLMAQVRPHPGTDSRWMFNWAHWFVGNSVQILAIATIFLSIDLKKAKLPDEANYVLTAFVILSFLAHLLLTFELVYLRMDPEASNRVNPRGSSRKSYDFEEEQDEKDNGSKFRQILIAVYILFNFILTGVIIGFIIAGPGKFK